MTASVWKFSLALADEPQRIAMPQGAQILHVHEQKDGVCLWALVDASLPMEFRRFLIVGTGHRFESDGLTYRGTAHVLGGALVWHVFEVAA